MSSHEQNSFFRQRRAVLAGLAGALVLPRVAAAFDVPDEPRLAKHDYGEVRRHFRTKLLQKGPAPDKYEPLTAPADAEKIFYRSGYGGELELAAWVSRYKRGRTAAPAVLFLHGGNAMGIGHWQLMKPYMDAGYVVMMPSLRGENGQRGNFSGFYDEVDDVLAAAERLAHLPGVDSGRLFIAGHSIGGTLTMLTTMSTHKFRAAAPISGNPNAFRFFNRYPQDIRFDDSNVHEFEVRSALCYAHSFKCPVRVVHGTEEAHFNDRADLLARRARAVGIHIETDTVAGNHTSALPAEIEQSIRFFHGVAA
ncbi:alpha/beta fold hydrolase [Rhizobium lentis]|uniref:Alpha/beta fold hydrolase n=1 Tax=Rhizobium lentis TaxID=1138194 RepID=A0A9Q3QWE1_9HYPH|nr:alpha/beta fold hydrolase [Rhizobium lentis]MBX4956948.1 alpha/beta fold hydrolase [Rhizobium lentis]MBX4976042.1 alpha/beta fold hydrolase [Rhizobium lentis]MBX4986645.1 alpha/beta fold hydrolase [Rhizobium lentis]MBX5005089.1 alpha/beta fold hydrolase [Rhizobium lentis]MBX5012837.1 alpha/beta fold hydrolase [Rhizobium lentis]